MNYKVDVWKILIAGIIGISGTLFAQSSGALRGMVEDPAGLVIASARVQISQQSGALRGDTETGADGTFEMVALPVGMYEVEVSAAGFKTTKLPDVEVSIGRVSNVEIQLELGVVTETVTTTASAQLIETANTQPGAPVESRAVASLPLNGRDTFQFVQLQPGVMSQLGADSTAGSDVPGIVSVNGGRGRSNSFNINGGDSNDRFLNLPAIQPSPDAIEEFRVLTNTFDAEQLRQRH